jgi:hypothetical protein
MPRAIEPNRAHAATVGSSASPTRAVQGGWILSNERFVRAVFMISIYVFGALCLISILALGAFAFISGILLGLVLAATLGIVILLKFKRARR